MSSEARTAILLAGLASLVSGGAASAQPPAAASCPAATVTVESADESCVARTPPGADLVPDLAVLKTPTSPAAMVLGVVDGQIQRPTTPSGLAVALAAGLSGQGEQQPLDNFAVEVTPYWLVDHPRLTAGDVEATRARSFVRNFSVSVATARRETPAAMEGDPPVEHRDGALGMRSTIWPGHPSALALQCEHYLDDYARRAVRDQATEELRFLDEWEDNNHRPCVVWPPAAGGTLEGVNPRPCPPVIAPADDAPEGQKKAFEAERDRVEPLLEQWGASRDAALAAWNQSREKDEQSDAIAARCLDDVHQRAGLLIDTAAAYSLDVPGSDLARLDDEGNQAATGWLTVAYVFETQVNDEGTRGLELSLLAAGRAQREWVAGGADARRLDAGGRAVLAWERHGVSAEGAYRRQAIASAVDHLWRVAVTLDYRLSGGTWASATFGKDFGATGDDEPVLAVANLQWNIGRDRGVALDRSASGGP